jgi:Delta6-protoilludene synthase
MKEKGVGLDDALTWVEVSFREALSQFQAQLQMLPSWGPAVDAVIREYVERLCLWIRGHDCWSFESEMYFGTKGPEIQRLKVMTLLQKVNELDATSASVVAMS